MKKYALRLYGSEPNPTGAPALWPKEVIEILYDWEAPADTIIKTKPEYDSYLAQHKPSYDAWYVGYLASLPANQPIVQQLVISHLPLFEPFAAPTYRTKHNATDALVSIQPGAIGEIDFTLTQERFVSGGSLVIENAEFGDYLIAVVEDESGLIPVQYRAALCEDWPIVAKYIEKAFVEVQVPGTMTPGAITVHKIDTSPLNAKISAGLTLSIRYYSANTGLTRRVAVNYHLTKKL